MIHHDENTRAAAPDGEGPALLGVYAVASRGSHTLDTFAFLSRSRSADTHQWTPGLRAHGRLEGADLWSLRTQPTANSMMPLRR